MHSVHSSTDRTVALAAVPDSHSTQQTNPYGAELACIPEGCPTGAPLLAGIVASFFALGLGVLQGLSQELLLFCGVVAGTAVAFVLSWLLSTRLSLFENVIVVATQIHRQVIPRSSVHEAIWTRTKTYHHGMLNGYNYSVEVNYVNGFGFAQVLKFQWWVQSGSSHIPSQRLVAGLGARFVSDGSLAIRARSR